MDPVSERERWRKVRRAPGYQVSSLGRVRSVDRTLSDGRLCGGVTLEPFPKKDGYLYVSLNGEHVQVSHLVLEAFDRPRPYGMEACHGPAGNQGNSFANLRWGTHLENERDKKRMERNGKSEVGSPPEVSGTPGTGDVH